MNACAYFGTEPPPTNLSNGSIEVCLEYPPPTGLLDKPLVCREGDASKLKTFFF